jgi:glycosyltransferase involved in cell wall biosynthesis
MDGSGVGNHKKMNRKKHVVIIDEELPYPAVSGKRIRTLNLLVRLARHHQITYLSYRNNDPDEVREASSYLRDHNIEIVLVDRSTPAKSVHRRGPAFYADLVANLLSSKPYLVDINSSDALKQAVRKYAAERQVDLWQCEWTPFAEAVRGLAGARWLIMAHNVESLIWQRYYETETNPLKRWYIEKQWRKMERYERSVIGEATRTVTVSLEDATLMRDRFDGRRIDVVDNGVDTAYFQSAGAEHDRHQILFLGSLDWRPNLDAISLLLDRIFPAVQAEVPAARLCIVGRNPPESLARRVTATPGVALHATVADVRPYLAKSGVMAVPLRIGGGSRLKILEALAFGLPVISTRIGAEGLRLEPGRDLVVVEDAEQMVQALITYTRDPGPLRAMAESGRREVQARYDWDIMAETLGRVWDDVAGC